MQQKYIGTEMFKSLLITLLLLNLTSVQAAGNSYENPVIRKVSTQQFVASALLRKNDQNATVKLVQSIENATSREEASGMLLNRIKQEMQGYSVLETLVSPVTESKQGCETWI